MWFKIKKLWKAYREDYQAELEKRSINKLGMYGETPRLTIGRYELCEFQLPPDDTFWIEIIGDEGAQVPKDAFELVVSEFFKKHF